MLHFIEKASNISVTLTFGAKEFTVPSSVVSLILETKKYGAAVQALHILLKQLLAQHHLNQAAHGGLGSHSLLMMIISYFKVVRLHFVIHLLLTTRTLTFYAVEFTWSPSRPNSH